MKRNPYTSLHPDLFSTGKPAFKEKDPRFRHLGIPPGKTRVTSMSNEEADRLVSYRKGDTPVFVPLAEMDSDQIRKLQRRNFTNEEWEELDEDDRDHIIAHDEDRDTRIKDLALFFVRQWKWIYDGDDHHRDNLDDSLEYHIRHLGDDIWREVPDAHFDAASRYGNTLALTEAEIIGRVNEAMRQVDIYDTEIHDRSMSDAIYTESIEGNLYAEKSDYADLLEHMYPDEIQEAVELIETETNGDINIDARSLSSRHCIDINFDTGRVFNCTPNWDRFDERVTREMDEFEVPFDRDPPGAKTDPMDRQVFTWPDGFYAVELLPSELPGEGDALGHCIGQERHGYPQRVRSKEIRAISIRRPAGRPLFTIALELGEDGGVIGASQVKGKSNRLPGFDYKKEREIFSPDQATRELALKNFSRDEAERAIRYIHSWELDVAEINDLRPAIEAVRILARRGDAWALKLAAAVELEIPPTGNPARGRYNPARGGSCEHGTGCGGFCAPYRPRAVANPAVELYRFLTNCKDSGDGEAIRKMAASETRITPRQFARAIGPEQWAWLQQTLGYDSYFPITRDLPGHIGVYRGVYRGDPAVFLRHSGVEWIFTRPRR